MFGLGMPEILLILAIALIVIGPKKLPELAKTLGRAMGEFKRSAQDFKRSIDVETTFKEMETPASDLKDIIKEGNKKKHPPVEPDNESNMAEPDQQESKTQDPPDKNPVEPDSPTPKDPENKTEQP
jgi:Tat protein translocase TatB subunit